MQHAGSIGDPTCIAGAAYSGVLRRFDPAKHPHNILKPLHKGCRWPTARDTNRRRVQGGRRHVRAASRARPTLRSKGNKQVAKKEDNSWGIGQ